MSALTNSRVVRQVTMKVVNLPLAAVSVFLGGMACIDVSTGYCTKGAAANANLVRIGNFANTVDNSGGAAGDLQVSVVLDKEIVADWYANATGGAAVSALFGSCYILDDQTVTNSSSGNSVAGRVWAVDSTYGVLVETTNL